METDSTRATDRRVGLTAGLRLGLLEGPRSPRLSDAEPDDDRTFLLCWK
jgi:hypothetical protein